MIFGIHKSGQDGLSHARIVAPPCCRFELSLLNELYREKFVPSITLIQTEIFGIHTYQVKIVCQMQRLLLPLVALLSCLH